MLPTRPLYSAKICHSHPIYARLANNEFNSDSPDVHVYHTYSENKYIPVTLPNGITQDCNTHLMLSSSVVFSCCTTNDIRFPLCCTPLYLPSSQTATISTIVFFSLKLDKQKQPSLGHPQSPQSLLPYHPSRPYQCNPGDHIMTVVIIIIYTFYSIIKSGKQYNTLI